LLGKHKRSEEELSIPPFITVFYRGKAQMDSFHFDRIYPLTRKKIAIKCSCNKTNKRSGKKARRQENKTDRFEITPPSCSGVLTPPKRKKRVCRTPLQTLFFFFTA
jgi:hypothetical protein